MSQYIPLHLDWDSRWTLGDQPFRAMEAIRRLEGGNRPAQDSYANYLPPVEQWGSFRHPALERAYMIAEEVTNAAHRKLRGETPRWDAQMKDLSKIASGADEAFSETVAPIRESLQRIEQCLYQVQSGGYISPWATREAFEAVERIRSAVNISTFRLRFQNLVPPANERGLAYCHAQILALHRLWTAAMLLGFLCAGDTLPAYGTPPGLATVVERFLGFLLVNYADFPTAEPYFLMNFNARQADHYELAGPARNFPDEEIVYNAQFGEELDWAGENPMVVNRIDQAQREWADLGCPDAPEHFDPMGRGPRGMPGWLALIRLTDHETRWTRSQQVLPLTYLQHVRFDEPRGLLPLYRSYVDFCRREGLFEGPLDAPSAMDAFWYRLYPRPERDAVQATAVQTAWTKFNGMIPRAYGRITPENAPWNPVGFNFAASVRADVPRRPRSRGRGNSPLLRTPQRIEWRESTPSPPRQEAHPVDERQEEVPRDDMETILELTPATQLFERQEAGTQTPVPPLGRQTRETTGQSTSSSSSSSSSAFSRPPRR